MTRDEFEAAARLEGFGEAKQVSFAPLTRSETHQHDKVSFVYVLEGEFILNTAGGARRFGPGEICHLDGLTDHAEESGSAGATILVARK